MGDREDEILQWLEEIDDKLEQEIHRMERIQKRVVKNSKRLRRIADSKGGAKLSLKDGKGEPTDEAFEVLRWITKQGKRGVTTKEFGRKYGYTSRGSRNDKKDELDGLFGDLIQVVKPNNPKKPDRIVNPVVRKYNRETALLMVEAEFQGKLECPECEARISAPAVARKDVVECPDKGCNINLYDYLRESRVS